MKNVTLICFLFVLLHNLPGQIIKDEIIIKSFANVELIKESCRSSSNNEVKSFKSISEDLGLYSVYYTSDLTPEDLSQINAKRGIEYAVYNLFTEKRQRPNDELYIKQWALETSKINKVWDVTTGGYLNDGEQLVVAVIDDGIDIGHEDIKENIFKNLNEKPNDKIDNDGNGYVDDYQGYNVNTSNGDVLALSHGSGVSGIIGATGNNSLGISGVNWSIKILPVYGVNKLDEIIQSYSYILKMKKLYNTTNGKKGAFIIVSNYSGGISKVFSNVEPYRSWCDQYDLLGLEGVLNVGATDNENVNVSIVGDMPSTCTSEYFISTTNLNESRKKVIKAGYSKDYIALAAPGELITTIKTNDKYETQFSGTSAAAPMVAGTIALLYSVPCSSFANLVKLDKVKAAKTVRDALKKGVAPTSELASITKWGGYLDAEAALSYMSSACDGEVILPSPKGALAINYVYEVGGTLVVDYVTPDEEENYSITICDLLGREFHREELSVPSFGNKQAIINYFIQKRGHYIINIFNNKAVASKLTYLGLK